MFVHREWFAGWRPATWQGRVYLAAWSGVWGLPTAYFVGLGLLPEAGLWTLASLVGIALDTRVLWDRNRSPRAVAPPVQVAVSPTMRKGYDFFVK